jgi:hypothetical protein
MHCSRLHHSQEQTHIPLWVNRVILNMHDKLKLVRHVCILFYNCMIISLYLCCGTCTYLSYWCVAGADANYSICPHVLSRLTMSLSSLDLGFPSLHIYTHCYK